MNDQQKMKKKYNQTITHSARAQHKPIQIVVLGGVVVKVNHLNGLEYEVVDLDDF